MRQNGVGRNEVGDYGKPLGHFKVGCEKSQI